MLTANLVSFYARPDVATIELHPRALGVPRQRRRVRCRLASGRAQAGDFIAIVDPDATALVLIDVLTNYWLQREAEDPKPYGIGSDRFIDAWTSLAMNLSSPGKPKRKATR